LKQSVQSKQDGQEYAGVVCSRAAILFALLAVAIACTRPALASADSSARVTVTDELGRTIEIVQPVQRMVSLAPSLTETIFALGAGDRLVGDTDVCDYPAEARTKPKVGGVVAPSLEAVVALRPDLVLATTALNPARVVDALVRLGVPVYVTDPHTVRDVLDSTARLSKVIGAGDAGRALVADLQARLDAVQRRLAGVPARRVLFVVWAAPLISIGHHTFITDALAWADAQSVVESDKDWPEVSLEEMVRLQPEYLVIAGSYEEVGASSLADLQSRPGWRDLEAVRDGRVAVVSDALARPCPRILDAIEEVARSLHPEAYASATPAPASGSLAPAARVTR